MDSPRKSLSAARTPAPFELRTLDGVGGRPDRPVMSPDECVSIAREASVDLPDEAAKGLA